MRATAVQLTQLWVALGTLPCRMSHPIRGTSVIHNGVSSPEWLSRKSSGHTTCTQVRATVRPGEDGVWNHFRGKWEGHWVTNHHRVRNQEEGF